MRGFFGNFGGFGRPSWSPLGGNVGSGGMIVGGNMGPFGSGIPHGALSHVAQPSLASTLLNTPSVVSLMMTSPVTAIAESFFPKVELPSITPSFMTAPHVGISTLPTMELGERLPLSVSSVEMKPDAIAPVPPAPTITAAVEKCGATPPTQEIAGSISANGPIETAAPKQSFKERVFNAFSNLGDFVADENPIILPNGTKDYLMGNDVQEKAEAMEGKVLGAAALAIPVVRQGYAVTKLVAKGVEAAIEGANSGIPGGLTLATPNGATLTGALEAVPAVAGVAEGIGVGTVTTAATGSILPPDGFTSLSFARKSEGKDHTPNVGKAGPVDRSTPVERKIDTPEIRNSFVKAKESSGEWVRYRVIDNRQTWHNEAKTQYFQKTIEKSEIEVYNKHGEHIGVIKPSDGELRTDLKVEGRSINIK